MTLSTGAKVGIAAAVVAVLGIGGYEIYKYEQSIQPPSPPPSGYVLTLSGPSTADEGVPVNYTANLTDNGTPVSGVSVTLSVTGPSTNSESNTTDSNGNATFSVTFPDTGTYQLQASAEVS